MDNKTGNKKNIAAIVELFMLFGIMLLLIVVITESFMMTRGRSMKARHLTEAVIAAENTMEVVMSSGRNSGTKDTIDALSDLDRIGNVSENEKVKGRIDFEMTFNGSGESGSTYRVSVKMDNDKGGEGAFSEKVVSVALDEESKPLYTLKSGRYDRRDRA